MQKKNLIIYQFGGLGNQLFQLVVAENYRNKYSLELNHNFQNKIRSIWKITDFFNDFKVKETQPKFLRIQKRNVNNLIRLSSIENLNYFKKTLLIASKIIQILILLFEEKKIYFPAVTTGIGYVNLNLKKNRNYFVIGYFQTNIFMNQKKISINRLANEICEEFIDRLTVSEKDFAIHIRLGDYLKEKNFGNIGPEYILASIHKMLELGFSSRIFIFSDDIELAKKMLPEKFVSKYVFMTTVDPFECLFQMSVFKGIVISNSSFSWWAARLDLIEDKVVCSPWPWFSKIQVKEDLLPLNWNRVFSALWSNNEN